MDINYKIILDNTQYVEGINNALAALRNLNAETEKTKQQTKQVFTGAAAESDKLALSLGQIAKSNAILISEFRSLGDMIRKSMSASSDVKTLETEVAKLKAQLEGLRSSTSGVASGMGNIKNQLVALRIAGKENTEEYRKLNAEYARLQANMLAVENSAKQYRQTNKALIADIKDTGQVAALAGANVISFGQILSDLPYGIRGVANNLQQLSATMVFLVAQAGSMRAAMSALFTAMAGPLGIIVAVQGALAAWDFYSNQQNTVQKENEETKLSIDEVGKSLDEERLRLLALQKVYSSTGKGTSDTERAAAKAKLVEILGEEAKSQGTLNGAIERYNRLLSLKIENEVELQDLAEARARLRVAEQEGDERQAETLRGVIKSSENIILLNEREITTLEYRIELSKEAAKASEKLKESKEKEIDTERLFREVVEDANKRQKAEDERRAREDERRAKARAKELEDLENLQDQLDEEFLSTGQEDTGESFPKPEKAKKKQGALAELLGITDEEVNSMLRAIRTIGKELTEVFNEINEAAQRNNEKVIEGLNDVISATEQRIDKESELAQKGLANNLEAEKAYLAEQQAQRDAAYQRQKELELQKLRLDSISQLSSLITASAQIWQTTSKILPPVGTALALGAIAAMFTSFAVSKAKAAELIKSGETFEEGGKIQGKRHSSGGEKYYNSDRSHVVEIEDGEYVTNRESTAKYEALLEAVNNDNLHTHNLRELLEGTGVELPFVDTAKLSARLKNQTIEANSMGGSGSGSQSRSDVSKDIAEIKGYVKGIAQKPTTIVDKDTVVTKTGNRTIVTKKWPQRS